MKEALNQVREKISKACQRSGRDPQSVTLIAVSKFKPAEAIEEAVSYGQNVFGENRVTELCEKYERLSKDIKWHMIGHLQRNKVRMVLDKAEMIHSVDSIRLAEAISAEALRQNRTVRILLEVNIAKEESKFGFLPEETEEAARTVAKLPGVLVCGLMTIAPFVECGEDNRVHFRNLYELSVDIGSKNIDNISMAVLSMGMSGDYEIAIEEGSTMIRVGTAIFGSR